MLCTVLIPTRKRANRFWKTFASLHENAGGSKNWKVVARIDEDDAESIKGIRTNPRLHVIVGKRGRGYPDLNLMYTECADAVESEFVWIMNDDCIVDGPWVDELYKAPKTGAIIQPESLKWGGSHYIATESGPFPIVPNGCWRDMGEPIIQDPADTMLDTLLRVKCGWSTHWLKGITTIHERDTCEQLEDHRKI